MYVQRIEMVNKLSQGQNESMDISDKLGDVEMRDVRWVGGREEVVSVDEKGIALCASAVPTHTSTSSTFSGRGIWSRTNALVSVS